MENDLTAKADKVFGALSKALAFPEKLPPNTRAVLGDAFDIVQAFRQDRRADDGDAVTEEWLRSVGFANDDPGDSSSFRRLIRDSRYLVIEQDFSVAFQNGNYPSGDYFGLPIRSATRRDVRRLCSALGIPLKESS